jgi:hypothetical protein
MYDDMFRNDVAQEMQVLLAKGTERRNEDEVVVPPAEQEVSEVTRDSLSAGGRFRIASLTTDYCYIVKHKVAFCCPQHVLRTLSVTLPY